MLNEFLRCSDLADPPDNFVAEPYLQPELGHAPMHQGKLL